MRVQQELIDSILNIYKPEYRYLESAEVNFPASLGRFHITETGYMEPLKHMTDVEAQICINQLCYVFFHKEYWKKDGLA